MSSRKFDVGVTQSLEFTLSPEKGWARQCFREITFFGLVAMADTADVKQKALAMYQKRVREHKLLESKVKTSTSFICLLVC